MSAPQKTPISVLNELALKLKITITGQYIEVPQGPVTLESVRSSPIFVYEYLCSNYIARGEGTAKKRAQHNAAENMLTVLKNSPEFSAAFLRDNISLSSPCELKVEKDAVGPLTDFCVEYNLPTPEYQTVREEGPAHDKRFTSRCFIPSYAVEATDRQKKQAKQQVALQMLTVMKNTIEPRAYREIKCSPEDNFKKAMEKFPNSKIEFHTKFNSRDLSTPLITDYIAYQNYHNEVKEAFEVLREIGSENPEAMLDAVLQKIDINYSCVPIISKSSENCIVALNINFAPDLTVCEFANSYDEASRKVARKALDYIRILCSPPREIVQTEPDTLNKMPSESSV